ncbi:MAG: response regulator [Deltaproteobacteria bacterium]
MGQETKILLVDDEQDFNATMSSWLTSKGYSVVATTDAENALKIIKESQLDLVLLDLKMPGLDGVELLKKVREFNKDLPVVVSTAFINDAKVKEIRTYGIYGVFYKGDDFSKGLALIESVLRLTKK